jgi:pyruvate-ferredoxin/flavodoxin oxidoreductase
LRGTAQNPDVYFQARETVNPFYEAYPRILQRIMDEFAVLTGRAYHLFDYYGDPQAERLIIIMGSGAETVQETVDALNAQGKKVGLLKVRLYRPFDAIALIAALPDSVQKISVLDRCKEPGSAGEPLYTDVITAVQETMFGSDANLKAKIQNLKVLVGGRYGLSSKEFTPGMVKGVFDNLALENPKNHFTIGIFDDLSHTSLPYDDDFSTEPSNVVRAIFFGLGSDGTVGANKNSIKIIGEDTDNYAQGYFVYDSKKSGSVTVSHLRFGPDPIHSSYLITKANFVACHQWEFIEKFDLMTPAIAGATLLLNSPYNADELWSHLPRPLQEQIIAKGLKVYTINAFQVAREAGMGGRINTVMQVCFFALSGVLPREDAIAQIKKSIRKSYGKKGEEIVQMNMKAVDASLDHLYQVTIPAQIDADAVELKPVIPDTAPAFIRDILGKMMDRTGDQLPVSALPCDGTYPTGTAKWEKRNVAQEIPVWDADVCVQCGKCVMVCPHAVIRA